MKHNLRSFAFPTLILAVWTAMTALHAQTAPVKFRGKLLRTEIRKTVVKPTFLCTLAKKTAPHVVLEFRGQDELTHTEVNIYQAMWEVVKERDKDGFDVGKEYAPIPGETIEGEETERLEIQAKDLLVNERFTIQEKDYVTDHSGHILDHDQNILAVFDTIGTRSFELAITHATLGEQVITLTRNLICRQTPEIPRKDAPTPYDILEAFGLNFTQQGQCGHDNLKTEVTINGEIKAGARIALVVDVTNSGSKPVSNLIARSFSRHPWLSGKLFYFGLVDTNKPAQFTRYITIPADADTSQPHFLSIAFWDILGATPDKQQRLILSSSANQ